MIINLLVGASLKGTLVLLVACAAAWTARRSSADLRHRIWLGALVAVAALLVPVPMVEPARLSALTIGMTQGAVAPGAGPISWTRLALWLWAAGAAVAGVRAAVGLVRLAGITRTARVPDGFSGVLASPQVNTPLTWGAIRPVILLPDYALDWPEEKRDWAIRHEQAHIARQDWLWQIFAQMMTCLFWFHPLVWWASSQLRNEAEHAADDAVLTGGADAAGYASQLVEVARLLRSQSALAGVGMVRTPVLEHRVTSILNAGLRRRPAGWSARFGIAGAALALLLPLAAYQNEPAHKVGEPGLSAPKVASMVQPEYTQEAKDAKIQGTVALGLEVNAEGKAQNIYIVRSLDKGLDDNAIAAIRQWTFTPGEKDGQPVTVAATIEVNYRLQ